MQKYFPTRSVFNEAKSAWGNISQMTNRQDLMSFLEKYFFRIEVSTGTANQYILGNEKGSAIKILILFQELILNAVKYSAFAPRDQRFLNIELVIMHSQLSIRVTNRFREDVAVKTSGIGHVIIENFSKLLLTRPEINTSGDIYTIEIKFANFWGKTNENLIRGG
jgi:two-component sensor histidine kinase